jgi:hypothetical protein
MLENLTSVMMDTLESPQPVVAAYETSDTAPKKAEVNSSSMSSTDLWLRMKC